MELTKTTQPAARRTQAERRALAERRLLASAVKLIAAKGVSQTTLAEIGEAAGYSRAITAVYFGDKNGLVKALWIHVSTHFQHKLLDTAGNLEGLAGVLAFVETYLTRTNQDSETFRALQVLSAEAFTSAPEIRESVATYNRDSEALLRSQIRAGIQRGEIRADVDPNAQAILIMGALRGAVTHWIIDPKISLNALRGACLTSVNLALKAA